MEPEGRKGDLKGTELHIKHAAWRNTKSAIYRLVLKFNV